ncbi:DUF7511 domain-containing protein [Natronobiforma cellulositropha]|uniref:DUF7511 domain-containing protein n=1 Tax=Natronobiforma cellulositropha TaxID=1679076 RepID=UPI0021D5ACC1|nr:hypothetical protein [Natronobiforma cellulositropha]
MADRPHSSAGTGERPSRGRVESVVYEAVVERYEDEPDVCTIFPRGGDDPVTTWISADEGSFVDVEDVR